MRPLSWLTLLSLMFFVACSSDDESPAGPETPTSDVGVDVSVGDMPGAVDMEADAEDPVDPNDPGMSRSPVQQGVSPDGVADVSEPVSGQARAGRYTSAPDFSGIWAHCREGDFRLYNEVIEVCVQAETSNRVEMFTGGMIVDARRIGATGEEVFDLMKARVGFNVQFAEKVEVVRDGTDSGPAVIRVTGRDTTVGYLAGIVGSLIRTENLRIDTEYRLYPDSEDVEVVTWVRNQNEFAKNVTVGDWLAPGDRAPRFRAGIGVVESDFKAFPWLATLAEGSNTAYLPEVESKIDELPFSSVNPWLLINSGNASIEPDSEFAYRRWLAVGDGSFDSVARTVLARLGEVPDSIEARLVDADSRPQPARLVEVFDGERAVAAAITDSDGRFRVSAPQGEYTFKVEAPLGAEPLEFDAELEPDVQLEVPALGEVEVLVNEEGAPRTALVKVIGSEARGEFFAVEGTGRIDLAPGTYTLVVTRGMEYELEEIEVEVVAGQTHSETVALTRVVDTQGWIAADFHQHMEPSPDSNVGVRQRILDNVAEGIDFVTSTDHDVVTDLQPYIDELGLQNAISTMPGTEISPTTAHINVYPVFHDPSKRGNGAIMLATLDENEEIQRKLIPDVIAAARAMPTNPVTQLNHPRGSTSLFETVRYEPTLDPRTFEDENWTTDFDTIEIMNRISSSCAIMADWATFLNTGHRLTGVGNSDSHRVVDGDPAGAVRNYLVSDSVPGAITDDEVLEALRNQRVTVASNAFIRFSDGRFPGDTITSSVGASVDFGVQVQTPSWSQVDRLHVVANGTVIDSLDANPQGVFDFDTTISASFDSDTWVVFVAIGPRPSTASDHRNPVVAFTNPVFVDVDGDSDSDGEVFEAPGLLPIELAAINETGWCD